MERLNAAADARRCSGNFAKHRMQKSSRFDETKDRNCDSETGMPAIFEYLHQIERLLEDPKKHQCPINILKLKNIFNEDVRFQTYVEVKSNKQQ